MKKDIHIKNIADLLHKPLLKSSIRRKINCIYFDHNRIISQLSEPMFLDAFVAVLVLSGTGSIRINYKRYEIKVDTIILLSVSHLFNFIECSNDFQCLSLLVSKEFMENMDSTDMIYRKTKYGIKLFNNPDMQLDYTSTELLKERICTVDAAIDNYNHSYHKEMILNSLVTFYLDLSNIIDQQAKFHFESNLTRYESIIKSFIELLVTNYRTEHKVEFYASRLNLSAHYLTLIIKRITGHSACDFIFGMLYSEARTLLSHSQLSIQEIATVLNFSDQSSFGKFFRRKSGLSPIEFRKGNIEA